MDLEYVGEGAVGREVEGKGGGEGVKGLVERNKEPWRKGSQLGRHWFDGCCHALG